MPSRRIRVVPVEVLRAALDSIRSELDVPDHLPPDVEAEAQLAVRRGPQLPPGSSTAAPADRREIPLLTIDPAESRDLDQAFSAGRRARGYRVHYAIADVAAFVAPAGAIDGESRRRGVTLYQPDRRTPLYPDVLGHDACSLLPDEDRQSILWTIDLDADGEPTAVDVHRAVVRSRRKLSYAQAQAEVDGGHGEDALMLLSEIGRLRQEREIERGGVSIGLPVQEVVVAPDGVQLTYVAPLPVEGWNAQISLLTGIVAARLMLDAGIGILRTLPGPDLRALESLRHSATALAVSWPAATSYAEFVRGLDGASPEGAALLNRAARVLGSAGYTAFDGVRPTDPGHSAVAAPYAHVTAPLRRLADRYANEVVLAVGAGTPVPEWARAALPAVADEMTAGHRRGRQLERAIVDSVEALVLAGRVGEEFDGTVVVDDGPERRMIQVCDPAIVAPVVGPDAAVRAGVRVRARLTEADPERRRVRFVVSA